VTARSYDRYDVNGFPFRSVPFQGTRPQAATINSGVMTRAINEQEQKIKYYGLIQQILEFSFMGDKELKVVFFVCNWFHSIHEIRHNKYVIVEIKHNAKLLSNNDFILVHQVKHVYYLKYPCQKMSAWWVVYKVNPCERSHTPIDAAYHFDDEQIDGIYQEEERPTSFVIELGAALDSLVRDDADFTVLQKRK
jgi:hypothetical protein